MNWIPVTERLPEDGDVVLIWCGDYMVAQYHTTSDLIYDGQMCHWQDISDGYFVQNGTVTHWMPLPEAP